MAKPDSFASESGLKNGPRSMNPETFGSAPDSFASKAELKETPFSSVGTMFRNGNTIDTFASKADLDQTPRKGYTSGAETPMSERSVKQSK
jgi:hypothetical protein